MKYLLIFSLSVLSLGSYAQDLGIGKQNPPYIEVTGTAIKKIAPDEIYLKIILSEKSSGSKSYPVEEQEAALKNMLSQMKIESGKLKLADATAAILAGRKKNPAAKLSKEYILELKSAAEVSKAFQYLFDHNIMDVSIYKKEHSQIEAIRKEVRIEAIKAAKDKALYLLTAIGEQLGTPLEIREVQYQPYYPLQYQMELSNVRMKEEGASGEIQYDDLADFEYITVSCSYYIKYAIGQ